MTAESGTTLLAHAIGIRTDLPVSLWIVMVAGAGALIVSFAALGSLWHTSKLRGDQAGAALPGGVQAVLTSPAVRWALRFVVLVLSAFVVAVALFGPTDEQFNLAPSAFYVTFWAGIVPASLLLGPVWRLVNPLRTLYAGLARLTGPAPAQDQAVALGVLPAAGFMLAYTWLELVYPDRAVPQTVGTFLVLYAIVQLVAALWYGESWFERGEAFEVWSTLLGRLAVLGRRADGRYVLRNPLDGSDGTPQVRGLALFVCVMIGSTGYDGVTRAQWYQDRVALDGSDIVTPTLGLLLTIGLVTALYFGATAAAGAITEHRDDAAPPTPEGRPGTVLTRPEVRVQPAARRLSALRRLSVLRSPAAYAHSLVPIAAGYAVAHYFSLLVLDGQLTWILLSNPLGLDGVDYFGTYRNEVDLTVVSPGVISTVQVGAIILGHVIGVVLAHDRAVRLTRDSRTALRSQLPLLVMMVAFTLGGLGLLLG